MPAREFHSWSTGGRLRRSAEHGPGSEDQQQQRGRLDREPYPNVRIAALTSVCLQTVNVPAREVARSTSTASPALMVGSAEVPAFLAPPAISRSRYLTSA